VAEALARFLKSKGVGVEVHGVQLSSTQFADDTQVLLPSPAHVPAFLAHMRTFAAATGQHLNVDKTKVLLVGPAARAQADALRQQRQPGDPSWVLDASVLGVGIGGQPQQAGQEGSRVFEQRLPGVLTALARLSHVKALSVFGRGLGSAAYGISKLLYAAEFDAVPSVAQCKRLEQAVAKVVDRGVAPDCTVRGFAGVKARLLAGKPALGGFGMLPWREHIVARHAWWGAKFVTAPAATDMPWVRLGRAMLRRVHPGVGPPLLCLTVG
jgi:hypothetical protein